MEKDVIELKIVPRCGIGPIILGESRSTVRKAMEEAGLRFESERASLDYFCGNSIQVEYHEGTASFIGVASHTRFTAIYQGRNVFDTPAKELFAIVADADASDTHKFNRNGHVFPNQILTLWEADTQYDPLERRLIWGQVGLGDARYLQMT
ncbi:hypothetical protein [Stenotrophomonas sp.]|uniref:hypothetical protein n=1 Tax=Stenotrophomonas sp. TaxID=69392 RepID=UPI002FCB9295